MPFEVEIGGTRDTTNSLSSYEFNVDCSLLYRHDFDSSTRFLFVRNEIRVGSDWTKAM